MTPTDIKTVDANLPRAKAAFHTLIPALGFILQAWPLIAFTGVAMALSVLAGPRYSLFGRLYRQFLVPALDIESGPTEALAPHRFSEALGAVFLLASAVLLAGFGSGVAAGVGWTLSLIVVALAAINWLAGYCVGCKMYGLIARLRSSEARV